MNKVKQIKPELRGLLEDFINFEEYQPIFKQFAKIVGYHGNDVSRIRKLLFVPDESGEIGFSVSGIYELFLEYQLLTQLIDKEPYKSLLDEYPEAIQNIRVVANKMLNKEDIGEEDLMLIFDGDVYAKRREKIDSKETDSSQ